LFIFSYLKAKAKLKTFYLIASVKQQKAEKVRKRAKKDKNAPKKPMSAFFCYQ
jgi:hypothetical protein